MPLHSSMREAVSLDMRNENKELVQEKSSRWLPDSDLAIFVREWSRTGFQGGLNWYRVATTEGGMRDVEVFAGKKIEVPMLFVSGRKDWGMYQEPGVVEKMAETCKKGCFKGVQIVEGAGHWVQQEQPERVVEIVSKFLWDNKALHPVAVLTAGPVVVPVSTPTHVAPALFVVPPEYTVGPGATYVDIAAWILIRIPGSVAWYAPGKETSDGEALPPPVTVIWSASTRLSKDDYTGPAMRTYNKSCKTAPRHSNSQHATL
ncbi:Epoxide hydrolase A [Lachnellula cervina]|uniref:Epoxide hydrolase A n=1 Tax=Lachnellula cervina TaxID=1316786 RepID=A0A7D8UML3_9HELO|nr:Epoxide hydrolase A [Lachnellula cervina]